MDESHLTPLNNENQEKIVDELFLKNHISNLNSSTFCDASVLRVAEATDHLLKSNLIKLLENLNLANLTTIEQPNLLTKQTNKTICIQTETWSNYDKIRTAFTLEVLPSLLFNFIN